VLIRGGHGAVTAALLDEQENELPSFTFADSIPSTKSAVRAPARWKATKDILSVRDKQVRVALRLEGRAILYALAFTESQE